MATQDISPKEELLTYYGQKYAKKLGLAIQKNDRKSNVSYNFMINVVIYMLI